VLCNPPTRPNRQSCALHLTGAVADYIERHLLQPRRALRKSYPPCSSPEKNALGAEPSISPALRKRAAEADAKLKRLYDAIANGVADLADPLLKDRIAGSRPRAIRLRADAARAEGALDRLGSGINTGGPQNVWQDGPQAHAKPSRAATATTSVHSRSASKSMRKKFGSWGRKARFCAPSPPLQAQKRRVLPCPFLNPRGPSSRTR
jgi:hypothetical protein